MEMLVYVVKHLVLNVFLYSFIHAEGNILWGETIITIGELGAGNKNNMKTMCFSFTSSFQDFDFHYILSGFSGIIDREVKIIFGGVEIWNPTT